MIYVLETSGMSKYFLIVCFSVNVNAIKLFFFDNLFRPLAKNWTPIAAATRHLLLLEK